MTGFRGQKFDFTGEDGAWYNLISDTLSMNVNMRVSSPLPDLPEITYITGLSVLATDTDGERHSIEVTVKVPALPRKCCPPIVCCTQH